MATSLRLRKQSLAGGKAKSNSRSGKMTSQIPFELRDEIHSPLAAIRNALYLISMRSDDFHVLAYVKEAETQAKLIAETLEGPRKGKGKAA